MGVTMKEKQVLLDELRIGYHRKSAGRLLRREPVKNLTL
jgi:hypothetical protein